ncbi:MAG: hypothetical protein A2Y73_02480 [Chloroflexi bacterium RBG_13_56_8]|nr:MAG: hypothetical protein A2Y73_02480 [Chloroflexi bacterium RBG_13_56_8]
MTTGSLGKQVLALSLPSTAENALLSIIQLVLAFWMGRVSDTALAAVAMGTTLRITLISPMMGLSAGGMAVVARHVGARDPRRADHAVMQTILLITFFVVPLSLLGQIMGNTFLGWMGATGTLREEALAFLRIIFGGLFFMEMLPSLNGVIRGAGHPEYTLRISAVQVLMLLLLAPVLSLGIGPFPALGVRGAAWASILASASGVGVQFLTLLSGKVGVRIHWRDVRPDRAMMASILKIALPTSLERLSPNLANALLMRLASSFGNSALTAYSIITQIFMFLQALPRGIGGAAATLVGQNLGAKQPTRAEHAAGLATRSATIAAVIAFGLLTLWPTAFLGFFDPPEDVLAAGTLLARYAPAIGATITWSTIMGMALAGAGDAISPMLVSMSALWLVQIPLAWAFTQAWGLGPSGIMAGITTSYLVSAVALTLRFRQGRWKTIEV